LSNPEWWRVAVVYQIYPRSFQDTDDDGIGDLSGITARLDYLEWLGIDALWLCPFYPSPQEDFGYDVSDYTGVDPIFGTLDDFNRLVDEAHQRDLRLILDFVPNHTSHKHPWFLESRSSRASPRRDWYLWADPKPDGSPPNNWRGAVDITREGSAWAFDEATGQYFMATFSPSQPDLNWRSPDVRAALLDAMRFWLERGADGFRVDMVDFIGKDAQLRDEEPLRPGESVWRSYIARWQYQANRPEVLAYIRAMRRVVEEFGRGRVLVGEVSYHLPPERIAAYGGVGLLDLPSNFRLTFLCPEVKAIADFVDEYDAACEKEGAWPNWCLSNHDTPRPMRFGDELARTATMLLLTLRGTPFLYYGNEIGMANVEIPPDLQKDSWTVPEVGVTRDGIRTPMQWEASANAGFTGSDVQPWLPVSGDHVQRNVELERDDVRSLLSMTRSLLALRKERESLRVGRYEQVPLEDDKCFAYRRSSKEESTLVVLNFQDEQQVADVGGSGVILVSTACDREGEVHGAVELRPYEGLVIDISDSTLIRRSSIP
jgi:alpha-glucosidase